MKDYDDWIKELDSEKKSHEDYRKQAKKIVERYEDEEDHRDENQFNILWSNTEVLHAALYAKTPTPDVRRRFLDKDPAGKKAAMLAERAISHSLDTYDFDSEIDRAVNNLLVPGMGLVRLKYKPYFEVGEPPRIDLERRYVGDDPVYMTPMHRVFNGDEEPEEYEEDDQGPFMMGEAEEELVYEEATCEYVNWDRIRWQPCTRWEDCDWVAIEHYPTKDDIDNNDQWKEHADQIPLGYTETGEKTELDGDRARARIYEIFDKKNRKNIEIAEGYNEILSEVDDPLGLEGFYPFPKPLCSTLKNGKFIPIPDYVFYQDQALELDVITLRINKLTEQLKYRGVYDASFPTLADVSNADDGTFIPIDDFQARFEGSGNLDKVIASMPLDDLHRTLASLFVAREEVKQTIYEITGIADIMRGATKSSETLGAQQLKTQFGSMRLIKRQRSVARFVRDVIRLKVEIMVENFSPETLQMMTGIEVDDEILGILKNDLMRSYRIDIETDSTITEDAAQEKQQRIELVTAVTGFIEKVGPMVQMGLMPANVAKELLGFAVRGFKIGRTLEEVLDEMGGDDGDPREVEMKQQMQQFQQQLEQQMQAQVQQIQEQAGQEVKKLQMQTFEAQKALAIEREKSVVKIQTEQIKGDISTKVQQHNNILQGQLEMFKAQLDAIQRIPQEQTNEMQELVEVMGEVFLRQQKNIDGLGSKLEQTESGLSNVIDMMKRPAKVLRDERGKVTGAVRE